LGRVGGSSIAVTRGGETGADGFGSGGKAVNGAGGDGAGLTDLDCGRGCVSGCAAITGGVAFEPPPLGRNNSTYTAIAIITATRATYCHLTWLRFRETMYWRRELDPRFWDGNGMTVNL